MRDGDQIFAKQLFGQSDKRLGAQLRLYRLHFRVTWKLQRRIAGFSCIVLGYSSSYILFGCCSHTAVGVLFTRSTREEETESLLAVVPMHLFVFY